MASPMSSPVRPPPDEPGPSRVSSCHEEPFQDAWRRPLLTVSEYQNCTAALAAPVGAVVDTVDRLVPALVGVVPATIDVPDLPVVTAVGPVRAVVVVELPLV